MPKPTTTNQVDQLLADLRKRREQLAGGMNSIHTQIQQHKATIEKLASDLNATSGGIQEIERLIATLSPKPEEPPAPTQPTNPTKPS